MTTARGVAGCLHAFLDRTVQAHADRIAIDVPPGPDRPQRVTWTYGTLDERAGALAARLAPRIDGERIVAVLLPRTSPWIFAAEVAVLRAGAAWMAIDPSAPNAHQAFLLRDAAPIAVVGDAAGCRRAVEAGFDPSRCIDVAQVAEAHVAPGEAPGPAWLSPRSLAYVIYTSGTTGRPKGVLVEHAGISNLVSSDLAAFGLGPGDRVAQGSSHAYDSSVEESWLAFASGATVVVLDDDVLRSGPDLVDWLREEGVTVLCPPPTLLRTTGCEDPAAALPDLRLLYVGGEALETDVAGRWAPGRRLENGYGPTECTVTALRARVTGGHDIPIGRPVPGNRAWVLDERLEEVPAGQPGELCLGGVGLARGYLNQPELSAERFPVHPRLGRIYRTGDLVRCGADGQHYYLGRIDDQVQLHGHRVELGAVDAALATLPGVREAASRVQGTGSRQVLAAFVVARDPARPPTWRDLEQHLRDGLPPHMRPARFAVLDSLPRLASGKLDRQRLPVLDAPPGDTSRPPVGPRDALEGEIAAAVAAALGLGPGVCVETDFFLDLGGDSVGAARVVSALRQDPRTASLTVRDVYEARTVAALAARARSRAEPLAEAAARHAGGGSPARVTAAQALWLASGLAATAWVSYAVWFHLLPWWLRTLGLVPALLATPFVLLLGSAIYVPLAVGLVALAKRMLIGRYEPLRAPAWSAFHLRIWLVERLAGLIPWGWLRETVFLNAALRALGARVGSRVHIHAGVDVRRGGWDLLEIGDDATIGQDAALRVLTLEAGHVVAGRVTIGARATIETRAGMDPDTRVGEDACLGALSWLRSGTEVEAGERGSGIPAVSVGPARPPTFTTTEAALSPHTHGVLMLLARFAHGLAVYVAAFVLPVAVARSLGGIDAAWVLEVLFEPAAHPAASLLLLSFLVIASILATFLSAVGLRVLGKVRPGRYSRWGLTYLRLRAKRDAVAAAGRLLSGTLLWPRWLRLAGMRVGRDCEVSTILDVVPESVEIGAGSFLADGVYLGGARLRRGVVELETTRLGRRTFLGNHVVIPTGTHLPDDVLIGSATVAQDAPIRAGSSWFGHPIFELPRREVVEADRRLTHDPPWIRRITRWTWEVMRFLLPVPPAAVLLAWLGALEALRTHVSTPLHVLGVVPLATLSGAAALVLVVVALKWALLGRVRPGHHPLWSCWCSRWDFLYVAWAAWCRPVLSALEGTLMLAGMLRLFGARIGRRVLLGRGFAQVVDPDMIHLEDGVTASPLYQAHSFEDRVLKIDHVRVEHGATVGSGAILFYGARVEAGASVAPQAVVMKHEHLKAGVAYEGAPAGSRRPTS